MDFDRKSRDMTPLKRHFLKKARFSRHVMRRRQIVARYGTVSVISIADTVPELWRISRGIYPFRGGAG